MDHQQTSSSSNPKHRDRNQNFNLEYFRIRIIARLGIFLGMLALYISRLYRVAQGINVTTLTQALAILAIPCQTLVIITIVIEYFLYKKYGPSIVKYSTLVDILILVFFTADWIITCLQVLYNVKQGSLPVWAIMGFVSFSWRTLMVTLIVQNWYLKIIAPALTLVLTAGYIIHFSPKTMVATLLTGITQLFTLIVIIYCEDKVKWKMVWANIQKEKWMQVNNFILNSIPENIMILDLKGEARFISEYCKSFLQKCHLPLDIKDLFKKIHDLKQQQYEVDTQNTVGTMHVERLATENKFLPTDDENIRFEILEELIVTFRNMITNREIQEKQFLIYDGKLKSDESHQEKSLEVKISFVQHFENVYILLLIRDTTQRDLLVTLEETNKYKDQLLASVSHELRAPLNGNINLVESAVNSPKIPICVKESCLIPALRSSKFLLHMINDILDMSQIKEKKLRLSFQSENLKETLKSTAQLIELQAQKKGVDLLLEMDPLLPTKFCTDHIRLSQIVLNLLNNAIKFTKEGVIKLTAETISGSSSIKITVEDSGIGMSQENVQKLFSSYTHIEFEGRQNMNPTGVGLGLNIAYNLAKLLGPKEHQGINVTSVPGHGSTFTFIIESQEQPGIELEEDQKDLDSCEVADDLYEPIQPIIFWKSYRGNSRSLFKKSQSSPAKTHSCFCPKILIVDDNPFNIMACETIFGSLEIKCESVYSGSACIKKLLDRQTKPCGDHCKQYSIVFMDQEMPEMSGSETVCEIRRLQKENLLSPDIKVIGCTAHKSKEEIDLFMEAGIDQCIHKPISAVMIKDILEGIEN